MKKIALIVGLTLAGGLLASVAVAEDKVLATVNGKKITEADVHDYTKMRQGGSPQSLPQDLLVQELVNRELISQDAKKRGLDKDKDYRTVLENQQKNLLAAYAMQKTIQAKGEVTEEMLRAEYDKSMKGLSNKEFQAKHILVDKEDDAKAAIKALEGGADFTKLATEKTTDPNGPDLGWFRPEQMVKPFSDAVKTLKKGEYTKAPVQTQFGWHVIMLEDTREVPPPEFDSLKDQIRTSVINKRIQEYIESLRKGAKIEVSKNGDKK